MGLCIIIPFHWDHPQSSEWQCRHGLLSSVWGGVSAHGNEGKKNNRHHACKKLGYKTVTISPSTISKLS